ncbi:ferritin heavy chain-like [Sturnira hondurensis]|uniref:ferritin heavy chain-like n=1 Tax=Sturnira hondurensis TaxID=192404 RepID=UPI001879CF63|nr:ferritin heavy chain-like [Sturnira hondurensis]
MATAWPPLPVCENYHPECEAAINNQVNLELHASYVYMSMACYFDRGDAALKHFSFFFLQQSKKEMEHADYLLGLQNRRAGNPHLWNIPEPEDENWENGLKVMECALHLAKRVHQSMLSLYQLVAEKHGQNCHFLECDYLREQAMFIQELGEHITTLGKRGGPEDSLAESLSDKLTLQDSKN